MKKYHKFFFVLLSLVLRGGVGLAVPANAQQKANIADYDVQNFTVNVMRVARAFTSGDMGNDYPYINLDYIKAAKVFLDIDVDFTYDNLKASYLKFIDNDGNIVNPDYNESFVTEGSYSYADQFPCDGWFTADGAPYGYHVNGNHKICVKFYEALVSTDGKYTVTDAFSDANEKTIPIKWVLVNPDQEEKKAVIFTINVIFYTPVSDNSYTCALSETDAPKLWGTYGKDGVIQMYMGGWKYQDNSGSRTDLAKSDYSADNLKSALAGVYKHTSAYYNNNNSDSKKSEKVDYWEKAAQHTDYVNVKSGTANFDYYQYYFSGYEYKSFGMGDNARSEFLETGTAGKYDEDFHGFGKGNPFTVPCFGTFLKFEPEQNGKVTLYILQNGIIDLSESTGDNTGSGLTNNVKWRPTYIVDELGNQLTDEKERGNVEVELPKTRTNGGSGSVNDSQGQKIYIGWDGSYSGIKRGTDGFQLPNALDNTDDVINNFLAGVETFKNGASGQSARTDEQWEKLTGYTKSGEKKYDDPYWTTGGTEMRMMPPSDSQDGWIAINKTYVKYTFPVKAGKSYYVFSNDSQIGFCGYEFNADSNDKVEGSIDVDDQGTGYKAGSYQAVTLSRSFKPGWNAICLPFSVTESKMREWFGSDGNTEDYELVTFNGCAPTEEGENSTTEDGSLTAHFFRHAYQDILAGYPYMLYIPSKAKALTQTVTFQNVTIENNVEMPTFSNSKDYMDSSSKKSLATIADYEFRGTFVPTTVPSGSYVVYGIGSHPDANTNKDYANSTGIRYVSGATPMNGLRAYLHPAYLDEKTNTKAVARIVGTNFSDVIDDSMWNDATVINDLMEEMGFFDQRENVYSITGQIVRQNTTSLVGLPKGIYIVKGKKYFVK